MTVDLDVGGVVYRVAIEAIDAGAGRFRVGLDGAPARDIEVRTTDLGLLIRFVDDGRVLDAAVTDGPGGERFVQLPAVGLTVRPDGHRAHGARGDGPVAAGGQCVVAPMPGRILRVLVQPGEAVVDRQPLVVIEAMKMENELHAVRAGRVTEIGVAAGESVEAGRVLLVLDDEA
jgi:biotin carboxyl carrier protein